MTGKYIPLFPIELYYFEGVDVDLNPLINFFYNLKSNSGGVKRSNKLGWQSDQIWMSKGDYKELKPLENKIKSIFSKIYKEISILDVHFWGNISPKESFNDVHEHGRSENLHSGVFYLKCNPLSGKICFYNDRNLSQSFYLNPKPNDLLLFPSSLPHMVYPNELDEDRISIAFNMILDKDLNT